MALKNAAIPLRRECSGGPSSLLVIISISKSATINWGHFKRGEREEVYLYGTLKLLPWGSKKYRAKSAWLYYQGDEVVGEG